MKKTQKTENWQIFNKNTNFKNSNTKIDFQSQFTKIQNHLEKNKRCINERLSVEIKKSSKFLKWRWCLEKREIEMFQNRQRNTLQITRENHKMYQIQKMSQVRFPRKCENIQSKFVKSEVCPQFLIIFWNVEKSTKFWFFKKCLKNFEISDENIFICGFQNIRKCRLYQKVWEIWRWIKKVKCCI